MFLRDFREKEDLYVCKESFSYNYTNEFMALMKIA